MEIYFTKVYTHIMATRQGLHWIEPWKFEMAARRTMIDYDDDFRWVFNPAVREWIANNAEGRIVLRYDEKAQILVVGAEIEDDLTLLATAF